MISQGDAASDAGRMRASSRPDHPFFRPLDLVVYALVAAVAAVSLLGGRGGSPSELLVHDENGERLVPLGRDTLLELEGGLGSVSVRIEAGRARIESSPCPGQQCVRRGWLERAGESSACLPSGVWIEVEPAPGAIAPDAVTR